MNQPWIYMCSPSRSPLPPPPLPSLWVFPVHHPWALVSCIQPGLAVCFTLDRILVSILSDHPTLAFSHRVQKSLLLHRWWECKLVQPLWRTVWRFLKKLGIELPCDPAIPLLGIHWGNQIWKRLVYPNVYRSTVYNSQDMEATWCPSADEWISKLWYIYTSQYEINLT